MGTNYERSISSEEEGIAMNILVHPLHTKISAQLEGPPFSQITQFFTFFSGMNRRKINSKRIILDEYDLNLLAIK